MLASFVPKAPHWQSCMNSKLEQRQSIASICSHAAGKRSRRKTSGSRRRRRTRRLLTKLLQVGPAPMLQTVPEQRASLLHLHCFSQGGSTVAHMLAYRCCICLYGQGVNIRLFVAAIAVLYLPAELCQHLNGKCKHHNCQCHLSNQVWYIKHICTCTFYSERSNGEQLKKQCFFLYKMQTLLKMLVKCICIS